ncbi:hypothetical protein [Helicobacter pylori]|uniref:hypothetical protein n=1 Tax=Helicobacter pylori TaxID=210 RepID=UPI001922B47B|nr:hypothetical protein [Helicobacter pylori]QQW70563.1 hypothetical protein HG582_03855 [Helicobacter pylori]
MFLKSVRILNFFHYAMGIFGSVILKLLFLKTGFYLLCFVILKLILKFYLKLTL